MAARFQLTVPTPIPLPAYDPKPQRITQDCCLHHLAGHPKAGHHRAVQCVLTIRPTLESKVGAEVEPVVGAGVGAGAEPGGVVGAGHDLICFFLFSSPAELYASPPAISRASEIKRAYLQSLIYRSIDRVVVSCIEWSPTGIMSSSQQCVQ